jgi:hypothetical protein
MPVTVTPEEFTLVLFDAATIQRVMTELVDRLGMADRDVRVEVDETTPIVRLSAEEGDPLVLKADSGAFEDPRRPRELSEEIVSTNAGRVLLRVRDRADGSFADAPADADLSLVEMAAWDTYSVGRLGRLGYRVYEPRWRYNFRNRHGFSDATDAVFDELWTADRLTWPALSALSQQLTSEQPEGAAAS